MLFNMIGAAGLICCSCLIMHRQLDGGPSAPRCPYISTGGQRLMTNCTATTLHARQPSSGFLNYPRHSTDAMHVVRVESEPLARPLHRLRTPDDLLNSRTFGGSIPRYKNTVGQRRHGVYFIQVSWAPYAPPRSRYNNAHCVVPVGNYVSQIYSAAIINN
jgi:hypothetical protein